MAGQAPERINLEHFPKSQHRPSLITLVNPIKSIPTQPTAMEFSHSKLLNNQFAQCHDCPDSDDIMHLTEHFAGSYCQRQSKAYPVDSVMNSSQPGITNAMLTTTLFLRPTQRRSCYKRNQPHRTS